MYTVLRCHIVGLRLAPCKIRFISQKNRI